MEKLLRLEEVQEMIGFKKSMIYKMMETKNFPKPLKVGKASRWRESEVQSWISSLVN